MIVITITRKPLEEPTVAQNTLKWGCGGINIDASRVGTDMMDVGASNGQRAWSPDDPAPAVDGRCMTGRMVVGQIQGRWPANLILSGEYLGEESRFFRVVKDMTIP